MDWISVKDRLPEEYTSVLVYIADRQSVIVTMFYKDFALARCGMKTGFQVHGVTHWMKIEPPKLEE